METPEETVLAFLGEWNKGREATHEAFRRWFTDETVWENIGWNANLGIQGAIDSMERLRAGKGVESIRIDTHTIIAKGQTVMTERMDYMVGADGADKLACAVMGIFEVKEGKIVTWRDYFDTAGVIRDL